MLDVHDLKRQGHSLRTIAAMTGLARNTVRKILRGEHTGHRKPADRAGKLAPFHEYLRHRRAEHPLSAVRLIEEIRPMGYTGSIQTLRRFLATLDGEARRASRLTVRFETPPGHQAQADWAYAGKFAETGGTPRSVYLFTFVLGFSRMLFARATTSMAVPTLIACHQEAFAALGGWPREILYDNMKQVRVGPGQWNEAFLDFARHHGFTPKTHRVRRPRTKGKVERVVGYVKDNFLVGRSFADLGDLNEQLRVWLTATANVRVHATTRERPIDRFPQETLTPVSHVPVYQFLGPVRRTVSFESMVHFRGSRYSVPPEFAGRTVEVSAAGGQIVVRSDDLVIAEHQAATRPGQCVVEREHLERLWQLTIDRVPAPPAREMRAEPEVARCDLRTFEEVLA